MLDATRSRQILCWLLRDSRNSWKSLGPFIDGMERLFLPHGPTSPWGMQSDQTDGNLALNSSSEDSPMADRFAEIAFQGAVRQASSLPADQPF